MTKQDKKTKAKKFQIPVEGSLGLLALGHIGVEAWRKKRDQQKKQVNDKK